MKKLSLALVLAMFAFGANAADATKQNNAQKGQFKDGKAYEIVGNSVFLIDHAGNKQPAPDGSYTLSDGSTLQTKDGKKIEATQGAAGQQNNLKKASEVKAVGGDKNQGQAGKQEGQTQGGSADHKDAAGQH